VCLNLTPYLQGTLYAYLNAWVKEWKLQAFEVELDLGGLRTCTGQGWHLTWQSSTEIANALACPTQARCVAVGRLPNHGYAMRTSDGGRTWSGAASPARSGLYALACTDADHCVAGGNGGTVVVTSDGGARWARVGFPYVYSPLAAVPSVTCVPGGTCYALALMSRYSGTLVYGSTDSGRTWTYRNLVRSRLEAMACVSPTACVALGPGPSIGERPPMTARTTRDGWASSTAGRIAAGWSEVTRMACLGRSLCYAGALGVSGKILASTDFGATWKTADDGGVTAWSLSCPTSGFCAAAGSGQTVTSTTDGGRTWKRTTISNFPASQGMTTFSLACGSEGHCVAAEYGAAEVSAIVVS
jgi:photosystem II stability/assembly factor-like uncharacterized protein